jgi:hypothetical protein
VVARTGQTISYATGDDGDLRKGKVWPIPRFTLLTNTACVRDNLTSLVWARDAFMYLSWEDAIIYCNDLDYGGFNDWRLPNINELFSLNDFRWIYPPLCNIAGTAQWTELDPWSLNLTEYINFWASTTFIEDTDRAYRVSIGMGWAGEIFVEEKINFLGVWPVRGGRNA